MAVENVGDFLDEVVGGIDFDSGNFLVATGEGVDVYLSGGVVVGDFRHGVGHVGGKRGVGGDGLVIGVELIAVVAGEDDGHWSDPFGRSGKLPCNNHYTAYSDNCANGANLEKIWDSWYSGNHDCKAGRKSDMNFSIAGIDPAPVYRESDDPHSGVVESSAIMRAKLAEAGEPVIVAFSRGKDSICAMVALMAAGVPVVPVHLYRVPGLQFEEDSLKEFEDFFQMKIHNLPHSDLWYYLREGVGQAPWQNSIAEAAMLEEVPHDLMWTIFKEEHGLPATTWVCDGIRAADSPMRRLAIKKHSPWTNSVTRVGNDECPKRFAHVVWDWKIADIRKCIAQNNVDLPIDYDLFGRTFDGIDYRFIKPLSENLPEDYEKILSWFPACELEMMRYEFL